MCALRVHRVVLEEMAILLEGRATAGRGDDNGPIRIGLERFDVGTRHLASDIEHTAMHLQCPAAPLTCRDVNVRAVGRHYAAGCPVRIAKCGPHDATIEQRRRSFRFACGPLFLARLERLPVRGWSHLLDLRESEEFERTRLPRDFLQTRGLIKPGHSRSRAHLAHVRECPIEHDLARNALLDWSMHTLLDLESSRLDQGTVLHTRRADSFAGPTVQALIHLLLERAHRRSTAAPARPRSSTRVGRGAMTFPAQLFGTLGRKKGTFHNGRRL